MLDVVQRKLSWPFTTKNILFKHRLHCRILRTFCLWQNKLSMFFSKKLTFGWPCRSSRLITGICAYEANFKEQEETDFATKFNFVVYRRLMTNESSQNLNSGMGCRWCWCRNAEFYITTAFIKQHTRKKTCWFLKFLAHHFLRLKYCNTTYDMNMYFTVEDNS